MIEYDRSKPLIFIHIPKAAGTTSQTFFQMWFGNKLLKHYFNEVAGELPKKHNLENIHNHRNPALVYGHFNKVRNFGVEDYYPKVDQFITILRDPFELTLSHYFYVRNSGSNWKDKTRIPIDKIESFLINAKPNMLSHFPREVTRDNYKEIIEEYFIEIGITECLRESMKWIAYKLGMPYDERLLGCHTQQNETKIFPIILEICLLKITNLSLMYTVMHYKDLSNKVMLQTAIPAH